MVRTHPVFQGAGLRLAVLALLVCAATAQAEPLPEDDSAPLTSGFGLPGILEGGQTLGKGKVRTDLSLFVVSHAVERSSGDEDLIIDGETTRLALDWRYGLTERIEVGAELTWMSHHPGQLDSLIESWHNFFGFPNGPRDERDQDLLEFAYANDGTSTVMLTEKVNGVGDLRLHAGYSFGDSPSHQRAIRVSVKAPTGDADKLLGSGGVDASVGFAGDISDIGNSGEVTLFYRANITFIGEPGLSGESIRRFHWASVVRRDALVRRSLGIGPSNDFAIAGVRI